MYSLRKNGKIAIVARGPLKNELFGVPAGKYVVYVRERFDDDTYGELMPEYPVRRYDAASAAWSEFRRLCNSVEVFGESGAKIRIPATETPEAGRGEHDAKRDAFKAAAEAAAASIVDYLWEQSARNICRLIDHTGELWKLMEAFKAEGVSNEIVFKSVTRYLNNRNN